jgi:DNA helicase-2/ATP-dependent DNA helicase PcrA
LPEELIKEVLPKGDFHLQEERRLFLCSLNQGKRWAIFDWAEDYGGKQRKKPSRFLMKQNLISEEVSKIIK